MILFTDTNLIGSFIIRKFTRSNWSHVAIEHNGMVIESVTHGGVRMIPLAEFERKYPRLFKMHLPTTANAKIFDKIKTQIGKKYDWTAIFAFGFNRDWQENDSWFCSELIMNGILEAGYTVLNPSVEVSRITPEDLFKFNLPYIIK